MFLQKFVSGYKVLILPTLSKKQLICFFRVFHWLLFLHFEEPAHHRFITKWQYYYIMSLHLIHKRSIFPVYLARGLSCFFRNWPLPSPRTCQKLIIGIIFSFNSVIMKSHKCKCNSGSSGFDLFSNTVRGKQIVWMGHSSLIFLRHVHGSPVPNY